MLSWKQTLQVKLILTCDMCKRKIQKKIKKVVDISVAALYNKPCAVEMATKYNITGCGSAWLERLVWDQEVAGSNPVTPTPRV